VCSESADACVANAWINELHYSNTGGDADEGVEIAAPAGTDLTGWTVVAYEGTDGTTDGSIPLSGTIPDQENGYGTLWFAFNGLENGAPDGIALVDDSGVVVQFLSYEGSFVGTAGAASGLTSEDIGVSEGEEPVGVSLQLQGGPGVDYNSFVWAGPSAHSRGAVNAGQSF
jgi:hypothetical protein